MSEYHHTLLDNGLQLVIAPLPHLHSVEIICYVRVGSGYEQADEAGLSHFVEHMMFRGNARHEGGPQIEQAFERLGSSVNAATDCESTSFYARIHPQSVAAALEEFAILLRTPCFQQLETERAIVLEEAQGDFNEQGDDICLENQTSRLMWENHPLGQPVIGFPETIRNFTLEQVQHWHQRHYVPGNVLISLAGPVNAQELQQVAEQVFGDWLPVELPPPPPLLPTVAAETALPRFAWVRDADAQLSVQLAWRTDGWRSPLSPGLRALRRLLGEGGASRLMRRLREESGLTYHVDATLEEFPQGGCFSIDFTTDPEKLVTVMATLVDELGRSTEVPLPEMVQLSRNVRHNLEFSRDNVEDLCGRYGWGVFSGALRTLEDELRLWSTMVPQAVEESARRTLQPHRLCFACVGPWRAADQAEVEALLSGSLFSCAM
ncbi:MAG: insulinase family protein [Desulfuromonadaceae bacterium]|nr:insulinase family protein [Desulfuromonadaceae bacterium]